MILDKKHIFIINPISFSDKNELNVLIKDINKLFLNQENNLFIHISKFPRDAIATIRKLIAQFDNKVKFRVYAVGGDGILFDCLNGVVGLPNVELGLLPYGNSNDFIRSFGDNLNVQFRNVNDQLNGVSQVTDVIYCGNNYAINTCTIGMESYAVHKALELHSRFRRFIERSPKPVGRFLYNLLYFIGGVFSIKNREIINQAYKITIDGKDFSGHYAMINIANGPCYGGDKNGAIAAMPNDGLLDIILFKSTGIFNFISKGFDYLYGKYYKYPDLISYHRGEQIVVRSKMPLVLQLDGEIFLDTNIKVKIIPNAIKFISVNNLPYYKRAELRINS
jgi:YegS/Rv2252/BmrU family lipid kinase